MTNEKALFLASLVLKVEELLPFVYLFLWFAVNAWFFYNLQGKLFTLGFAIITVIPFFAWLVYNKK